MKTKILSIILTTGLLSIANAAEVRTGVPQTPKPLLWKVRCVVPEGGDLSMKCNGEISCNGGCGDPPPQHEADSACRDAAGNDSRCTAGISD